MPRLVFIAFLLVVPVFIAFLLLDSRVQENNLPIWGGLEAIGAEIFLDGKKVGVMEQQVYEGPTPTESEVNRHREERRPRPLRPGDLYSTAVSLTVFKGEHARAKYDWEGIPVSFGKHEIAIVTKDGKRLAKQIVVDRERLYMSIDFNNMTID
jgi:hypothetical protein